MSPVYTTYPCTVTLDRYGGTYAGGVWIAWPLPPWEVPSPAFGENVAAATFWDEYEGIVGRGLSPTEAMKDLEYRYKLKLLTESEDPHG